MVLDAHRSDDQSHIEYSELAESLISNVGSKDALNLALALLARTALPNGTLDDKLDNLSLDR